MCQYQDTFHLREFPQHYVDFVYHTTMIHVDYGDCQHDVTYDWYYYQSLIAMSVASGSVSWKRTAEVVVVVCVIRDAIFRENCKMGIRNKLWISCHVVLPRKLPVGLEWEVILIACIFDSQSDYKHKKKIVKRKHRDETKRKLTLDIFHRQTFPAPESPIRKEW